MPNQAVLFPILIPIGTTAPVLRTPWATYSLMAVNLLFFVFTLFMPNRMFDLFGLHLDGPIHQYFTYSFMHGGFLHIFFNMLFFWLFACGLEYRIGWRRLLLLYAFSALAGGIAHQHFFSNPGLPLVGASGAVFGVIGAFMILFPYASIKCIFILLLLVVPLTVRTTHVLSIFFLLVYGILQLVIKLSFLNLFVLSDGSMISTSCHMGGLAAGAGLVAVFYGFHAFSLRAIEEANEEKKLERRLAEQLKRERLGGTAGPVEPPRFGLEAIAALPEHLQRVHQLLMQRKSEEARRAYSEALNIDPRASLPPGPQMELIRLLLAQGDREAAIEGLQNLLEHHGGDPVAAVCKFELARLLLDAGRDPTLARQLLNEYLKTEPPMDLEREARRLLAQPADPGSGSTVPTTDLFNSQERPEGTDGESHSTPPMTERMDSETELLTDANEPAAERPRQKDSVRSGVGGRPPNEALIQKGNAPESETELPSLPFQPAPDTKTVLGTADALFGKPDETNNYSAPRLSNFDLFKVSEKAHKPSDSDIVLNFDLETPEQPASGDAVPNSTAIEFPQPSIRAHPTDEQDRTAAPRPKRGRFDGMIHEPPAQAPPAPEVPTADEFVDEITTATRRRPELKRFHARQPLELREDGRYSVILAPLEPIRIPIVLAILGPALGMSPDAAHHAMLRRRGILLSHLTADEAQSYADEMTRFGQSVAIVEENQFLEFGEPLDVIGYRDDQRMGHFSGDREVFSCAWDHAVCIGAGSISIAPGTPFRQVIDLYFMEPNHHLRIWEAGFTFPAKSFQRRETLFRRLAGAFSVKTDGAIHTRSFEEWLAGGASEAPTHFYSLIEFENYLNWHLMAYYAPRKLCLAPK